MDSFFFFLITFPHLLGEMSLLFEPDPIPISDNGKSPIDFCGIWRMSFIYCSCMLGRENIRTCFSRTQLMGSVCLVFPILLRGVLSSPVSSVYLNLGRVNEVPVAKTWYLCPDPVWSQIHWDLNQFSVFFSPLIRITTKYSSTPGDISTFIITIGRFTLAPSRWRLNSFLF